MAPPSDDASPPSQQPGDSAPAQAPSSSQTNKSSRNSSTPAPKAAQVDDYRPSFDDEDGQYAIDSYQSSKPTTHSSENVRSLGSQSSNQVVFDADAKADPRRSAPPQQPQQGRAPTSYQSPLPAWSAQASLQQQARQAGPAQARVGGAGILPDHHSYSTSQGWSISHLCLLAWAFPPFTSVLVLIWETENVRVLRRSGSPPLFARVTELSFIRAGPRALPCIPIRNMRCSADCGPVDSAQLVRVVQSVDHLGHGFGRLFLGLRIGRSLKCPDFGTAAVHRLRRSTC